MNKVDNFSGFVTIFSFIIALLSIISFMFSIRVNKSKKKCVKNLYIRKMEVDEKWIKKEKNSMKNLKRGNIKCHILKNSAPTYNVGNWVKEMNFFMKKPIFMDLFLIEGNDADEEH